MSEVINTYKRDDLNAIEFALSDNTIVINMMFLRLSIVNYLIHNSGFNDDCYNVINQILIYKINL